MNERAIERELDGIELGDERLNKRSKIILNRLFKGSDKSLKGAFNGWDETKAVYRFLDNDAVDPSKLVEPHINKTTERFKGLDVILCIQDTTILDYSSKKQKIAGLGKIRRDEEQGLLLHPTIALSTDRLCLGTICYKTWVREQLLGKKARSVPKPVEEKESIRWIESYRRTEELAREYPEKLFINISDREADFYELFHEHNDGSKAHLIVRGKSNRVLLQASYLKEEDHLWEKLYKQKPLGNVTFRLEDSSKKGAGRVVTQSVRCCKVRIGPNLRKGSELKGSSREITAILVTEDNPPRAEDKVEWMLLTTLSVDGFNDAVQIIDYYRSRWEIELYFKILKSGCKIEELQLKTRERIERCLVLYMVVSWRIIFLTMIGRSDPSLSCEYFYDESEWKAAYMMFFKKACDKPPSIGEMNRIVASFGGFLGRKGDGEPGIKTMWIGLQRLADFTHTLNIVQNICG